MKRLGVIVCFGVLLCAIVMVWVSTLPGARGSETEHDYVIHIVEEGDTLSEISTQYFGTVRKQDVIGFLNGIDNPSRLRIDKKLVIPVSNNYFLCRFGIDDFLDTATYRGTYNSVSGRLFVGIDFRTRHGMGNAHDRRFVVIRLDGKDFTFLFDSNALLGMRDELTCLDRLGVWKVVDLDGDGEADVLASHSRGEDNVTTQYAFHYRRGRYEPYLLIEDLPLFRAKREKAQDGSMVFTFLHRGSEEKTVVPWKNYRGKSGTKGYQP